jgi:hypothetical protein
MGWEDSHLRAFNVGDRRYSRRGTLEDTTDESRVTLNSLLKYGTDRFKYTYDFGDDWEHLVVVEKPKPGIEASSYPVCVAGKRNCPPEDCGGFPATNVCSKSSPIPPIRSTPKWSSGSAKGSIPKTSISTTRTLHSGPDSAENSQDRRNCALGVVTALEG